MNKKAHRFKIITTYFNEIGNTSQTISQIYDGIYSRYQVDVSRKTVERNVHEMITEEIIVGDSSGIYPTKYQLKEYGQCTISLSREELNLLVNFLSELPEISTNSQLLTILNKLKNII